MPSLNKAEKLAAHAVRKYDGWLLRIPGVTAVGVGHKITGGKNTGEPCVKIFVRRKAPTNQLPRMARLPAVLDIGGGELVRTDIVEGGPFYLQHGLQPGCGDASNPNNQRIRPARPGASIGDADVSYGTFGGIVIDDASGQQLILSNYHILVAPGYPNIFQPGVGEDDADADDMMATLYRDVPFKSGLADAAVAQPNSPDMICNEPLNGVPAPSPDCRAIGLLFAGDESTASWLNPIQQVLDDLQVSFPSAGSVALAQIGMAVQKTGRTTARTTGIVQCLNATVSSMNPNPPFKTVIFRNQIATTCMSQGGDSGSLVLEDTGA